MLLLLVGAAVGLILVLSRRRVPGLILFGISLLIGLAMLILFGAMPHHDFAVGWLTLVVLIGSAILLFSLVFRPERRAAAEGNRHLPVNALLLGFLFLCGLALILYAAANRSSNVTGWILLLVMMGAAIYVFVWLFRHRLQAESAAIRAAGCPPVGLLRDFLAERLPPREHTRLAAHLEHCTACQRWVEGHTAEHKSWAGVARKLSEHPPAGAPALQRVIEQLKKEPDPEATHDAPVFSAELPLGFLSPPEKEGQLGRLERYEVLEEVGRGGMGVVLKAFDPSLHRVVAIKVLAPQLATSGVARQRFLREAKAAAAVSHDHIVTIHAVDEANGLPYLVMQYVAGPSLQQRIDKEGALELTEILRIGMQTAAGLAAAHGHGIVHRDIKPANILLEEGVPRVKITDFGLARAMDDASLTQSGFVAGSPLYMAPEQARGETLDQRADLFSMGSVLYTMCTGRPPFRAANTLAVLRRVCDDTPRPIRETHPEIPDWLAAVVEKLMAKDPADRYQSAAEVGEVLGRNLAQLQNRAWVPPPAAESPKAADLPTSVTICPSCGASLHVPERMVGTTVHCGECGKPFRAEGPSEEIRVARPVPSPFGRRGSPSGRRGRPRPNSLAGALYAILFLMVGVALLGALLLSAFWYTEVSAPPQVQAVQHDEAMPGGGPPAPIWQNTLGWFPAGATLFGMIDRKAFGSLHLDDEWGQTAIRLTLPEEARKKLTPEILDGIRIDGVSLAYYEERKFEKSQGILQLEGQVEGGRLHLLDILRAATSEKLQAEDGVGGKSTRVFGPELPFALGLFNDQRLFLARSLNPGDKGSQHLNALERIPCFDFSGNGPRPWVNIPSGNNPPWLTPGLSEIPPDACGFCVGEIPSAWRKVLTEGLKLRTCPHSFVCYLKREGDGVALSITLSMDKAGEELILMEDLEKWRRQGLDALQAEFPSLREEPAALALLGQTLNARMRWGANPGSGRVGTWVQIPGPTVRAIGQLVERASQGQEDGN
jgi:serine/threonine protein kinase